MGRRGTPPDLVERNEKILAARLKGDKLADIGRKFDLSSERVRQICVNLSMKRIKEAAKAARDAGIEQKHCLERFSYEASRVGLDLRQLTRIVAVVYGAGKRT